MHLEPIWHHPLHARIVDVRWLHIIQISQMLHGAGIFTYKTGWLLRQMLVNIPYMEHMGISKCCIFSLYTQLLTWISTCWIAFWKSKLTNGDGSIPPNFGGWTNDPNIDQLRLHGVWPTAKWIFVIIVEYHYELLQCEAPKISKLVYNSNNYGLW